MNSEANGMPFLQHVVHTLGSLDVPSRTVQEVEKATPNQTYTTMSAAVTTSDNDNAAIPLSVPPADQSELDLTNSHLQSLKDIAIPPSLTALDLTANRLKEIDPRILALAGLRTLNFRQNLLADVTAWQGAACKGSLEDLEFRDNQLSEIPQLSGFCSLRRLEYSYNEIRSMAPLAALAPCPLQELYMASNKINAIAGIAQLTDLRILELGSNRIKLIEQLDTLTGLQELWLGRNRISVIANLQALTNLRRISVQSNRLESMLGLESCTMLEELYLSHNGIRQIEGLGPLVHLKILDVSANRLTKLEGLDTLTQLEDLWLNDNSLPAMEDGLAEGLHPVASTLTTVYLENNPAAAASNYKAKVVALLKNLKQLDAHYV